MTTKTEERFFEIFGIKPEKQICGLRPELKGLIDDTCCKYNIEAKTSY